jgi:hypothetical protein
MLYPHFKNEINKPAIMQFYEDKVPKFIYN